MYSPQNRTIEPAAGLNAVVDVKTPETPAACVAVTGVMLMATRQHLPAG
jgi:hypothetical protein